MLTLYLGKRRFEGDADGQKYDNYLLPGLNYTRYEIEIGSIQGCLVVLVFIQRAALLHWLCARLGSRTEARRSCKLVHTTNRAALTSLQVRRIRTDVHSPTNFRVLGPLSNEQEFAKAFNCPLGSRYNPEKKCHVRIHFCRPASC